MLRDMRHLYTTNLSRPTLGGLTTTEVITAVVYVHITLLLSLVCVLTRSISADLRGAVWGGSAPSRALCWELRAVNSLPEARLPPGLSAQCGALCQEPGCPPGL